MLNSVLHFKYINTSLVVLLVMVVLFFTQPAYAQYKGFTSVENLTQFKTTFSAESKKIQSIKSNFIQEKNLSVLSEKILSEGKFSFKRPNRVRIEYQKPFQYLLIMNGDQILIREHEKENKMNVKSNKLFQQVNRIVVDCVQGTILDNKDFTVRVFQNDNTWLLEMTPVGKALKEFFQTVIVYADKKDYSISTIDMREPSGDNTLIRFTQKELNATLSDDLFIIK